MARTATKIFTTLAVAAAITAVTPAAVQAQADDEVSVQILTSDSAQTVTQAYTAYEEQVKAEAEAKAKAEAEAEAQAAAQAEAEAQAAAAAASTGPFVISSSCVGGQDAVDRCLGATYYAPVADYLGVPYYAQHNGLGGEAWLSLQVGDTVVVDGVTYTVAAIRTVSTGGDVEQIAGMGGAAYLQTCLDDAIHSNVYALVR